MRTSRRLIGLFLALVLLATGCRAESTVGDSGAQSPDRAVATSTPPASATGEPTPTGSSTPRAEPTPTATPEPAEPLFDGAPPEGFEVPSSWDEPLVLDPDVTEGVLPNGLTYLVKQNDRPGSQAQLRLVVRAGSLNEDPGTEGVAHFLEHMMFNGTERFPGNDIVQVLEGFGSGFGPDVNAYTSYGETVYELQLPARSTDTLQLGLDVLYQWATAVTLEQDDVVAERGVVREEYRRAVEPLSGRLGAQIREVLFAGTDYLGSDPIGDADVIDSMSPDVLRAFYERWYRPELMTIVAVGDFDVADMERRIAATFVQPPSDPVIEPLQVDDDATASAEPVFDVLTDGEIQSTDIEVLWRLPDAPPTNRADLRAELVALVTISMVDIRLFERLQGSDSVLLSARAGTNDLTDSTQIASVSATLPADAVGDGLAELLVEIEQARQYGFTEVELQRELDALRVLVGQQYSERDTRQDDRLARDLVQYALGRDVLLDPDDQLAVYTEVLDSMTVDDAQRFLFEVLDAEPYVIVTAPASARDDLPEPEELAVIYDSVVDRMVDPPSAADDAVSDLMAPPEPAAVVDRQRLDPLDATIVTYENGARLVFRQTQITENVVALRAESPGGFFAVEGAAVPLLDRTPGLVAGSGYESIDVVALNRLLSGSLASLSSSIGRTDEYLFGEGSTGDLELIFQLVHLQMTESRVTDLQIRQFDEQWRPLAENPESNPAIAADLELWRLRYGDSPWFRLIPTIEDLEAFDPALQLEAYRDRFADAGDFVFAVVGDFDPDELVDLGARYLGTLPDSGRRETPIDRDPGLPEENLVATVAAGVGDQGRVRINWESPYPFSLEAEVTARALELVVDARLRDRIREELGASYAPNASVSVLSEPKPWVDTIIEVESDPERIDEVSQAIRDELDRIRAGDLDPRYLELAVEQMVERYRFFNNNDWLDLLLFHTRYPDRPAGEFRSRADIARSLTVADIVDVSAVVFPETRSVEVRLVPAEG